MQETNLVNGSDRPKLGLVLSGGGAKGMAHVGVIRAMEQAGLKADYVVGTSMGSVVGGLYSLGYSSDEMEQIIRSIDWDLILSNRVSFEDISFEEKEYYNRYLLEFPVINGKLSFPSGLIEGQTLSDVLHYYTWPANGYESFDDFPIPFRCVATDISTGEPIVFGSGYLQDALRSSIAIPTVFSPFELENTSVVDGGVVNNFPVDIVREMGADIVIGVNVSDEDFLKADELESFASILMQLAMAESLRKTSENIKDTDVYIKPDLGPYSTGSFGNYEEILRLGDEAGQAYLGRFKELAKEINMNETTEGIGFDQEKIKLNSISVKGNRIISDALILSKFTFEPGEMVDRDDIRYGIDMVFGVNAFYKVDYSLTPVGEDIYDLTINTKEKPATLLSTAFHYDNRFSAGILLNFMARDWLGKLSRSVFLADISENPKFRFDYYKYTGESKRFAFNGRINYLNSELPQFEEGRISEVIGERNFRMEANMISTSSLKQTFYLGMIYEVSRSRAKINVSVPEDIRSAAQGFVGLRASYYRNSQNDRNFPTKGAESLFEPIFHVSDWTTVRLQDGVDSVFFDFPSGQIGIPADDFEGFVEELAPDPHLTLYWRYSKFLGISPHVQFQPRLATGITVGSSDGLKSFNNFFLGGIQNLRFVDTPVWGLSYGEVTTPNFVVVGGNFQLIPFKKVYIRAGANWLGYSDYVSLSDEGFPDRIFQDDNFFGYGADISYQSIIGPITIGISSNSNDGVVRGYFSLGYSFAYSDR
ncbi:patatin-like phospholipase family protein [Algoriphagus sediminis]|nr:patatin-like phospholipase family protein [Algoriphagus sediminis]